MKVEFKCACTRAEGGCIFICFHTCYVFVFTLVVMYLFSHLLLFV